MSSQLDNIDTKSCKLSKSTLKMQLLKLLGPVKAGMDCRALKKNQPRLKVNLVGQFVPAGKKFSTPGTIVFHESAHG